MSIDDKVKFEVVNHVGIIELNAPKKLNSLDTQMLAAIRDHLNQWKVDDQVRAILMTSSSQKAFCAGGDVKSLTQDIKDKGMSSAYSFFNTEYSTDYLVYQIEKPIIALVEGICMGGGLGLIQGASYRVFNDQCMIAMPEVSIGLFPDVGASYFLNKTKYGRMIGLTGYRLKSKEAQYLGLCDFVHSTQEIADIKERIIQSNWTSSGERNHEICLDLLGPEQEIICGLEDGEFLTLEPSQIETYESTSERVQFAKSSYLEGSPLSRQLIEKQFQISAVLNLRQCFLMEWQLALNCCEFGDFVAGVTTKLIEKNNDPKWKKETELSLDDFFIRDERNQLDETLSQYGL